MAVGTAALLAGTALVVHRQARRAERDNPPRGRFIDVGGVRLHYLEHGQGTPVVLIHGNGASAEDFVVSGVFARAAERHRVIAFDRPGFGHSTRPRKRVWTAAAQAELLLDALRRLGIERPILVGHSWGTLVALAMAADHPDDIGGLVLLSGYYFPTARMDVPLLAPPAIPVIGDVLRYTVSPLLGRLLAPKIIARVFAPAPVPPRFAAEFPVAMALRPSQIRASAADTALMVPGSLALRGRFAGLRMPAAILAGADDKIVDVERHARRLHHALPGSTLELVPAAGHMVHHLVPDQVVAAIDRITVSAERTEAVDLRAAE